MNINRVTLTGNLTRDPELRANTSGTPILNFGIAVSDRVRNPQTGEWTDRPNFIDCVLFGARAEGLYQVLEKGMKVALDGKLRYTTWEKNGQKRSKIEVAVDDIDLFFKRDVADSASPAPEGEAELPSTIGELEAMSDVAFLAED